MGDICALCSKEDDLRISHIMPKFFIRWLKHSGVGFIRESRNFNIRKTDGPKLLMLCSRCEGMFSKNEAFFANSIFFPIVENSLKSFQYDKRLAHFLISVLWRLIEYEALPNSSNKTTYQSFQFFKRF